MFGPEAARLGSAVTLLVAACVYAPTRPVLGSTLPPPFTQTLQVHDEVILEGPRETAEEARRQVVACMRSPFSGLDPKPLLVDLLVDSKFADTWYEAK